MDVTELIKEARTIGVAGGSSDDARRVLFKLADALEALVTETTELHQQSADRIIELVRENIALAETLNARIIS